MDFILELLFDFVLDLLIELIAAVVKSVAWLFRTGGRFVQRIGGRETIYFSTNKPSREPAERSAASYPTRRRSGTQRKASYVLR